MTSKDSENKGKGKPKRKYPGYIVTAGPLWKSLSKAKMRLLGELLWVLTSNPPGARANHVARVARIPLKQLPAAIQSLRELGIPIKTIIEQVVDREGCLQKECWYMLVMRHLSEIDQVDWVCDKLRCGDPADFDKPYCGW